MSEIEIDEWYYKLLNVTKEECLRYAESALVAPSMPTEKWVRSSARRTIK